MLSDVMLNVFILSVVMMEGFAAFRCTVWHYAKRHYPLRHYVQCHYVECHSDKCRYAQ